MIGKILVASTEIKDDLFKKSVVLITQHDASGTLGLILNRKTSHELNKVWSEVSDGAISKKTNRFLMLGGPVRGPLAALLVNPSFGEIQVAENLWYSCGTDNLISLGNAEDTEQYCIYTGFAAWRPDQLKNEICRGAWHITNCNNDFVFNDLDALDAWKLAGKQYCQNFHDSLGIKRTKTEWN